MPMPYRPRFSIYTATAALRFPMTWTPMALHEERDGKLRSGQATTKVLWWREGRKYLKRLHVGAYGTWRTIRVISRIAHLTEPR